MDVNEGMKPCEWCKKHIPEHTPENYKGVSICRECLKFAKEKGLLTKKAETGGGFFSLHGITVRCTAQLSHAPSLKYLQ